MSFNKLYILLIFNISFLGGLQAQEFHFTQYELSPTLVNPALTGQFSGTYRGSGVFRDQFRGSANRVFQTFSLTVDVPIITGFRKSDWIGGGISLTSDHAAESSQKMSGFGLNLAYHLGLDKKQTRILSIGTQFSSGSINYGVPIATSFTSGLLGGLSDIATTFSNPVGGGTGGGDPTIDGGSLSDLHVGLLYNVRGKESDFKIGLSVDGILGPNRAYGRGIDNKTLGINAIVMYDQPINKKLAIEHGLFFATQDAASFWNINSRAKYLISPEKDMKLIGGLGTRSLRSVLLYAGVEFGPWRVGLGYDLDIASSTTATDRHKAIELGVTYLGIINKRPKPDPIIYCPRI